MEEQSPKALSQHSTPICAEVPLTFAIFLAFLCEPLLALLVNLPRHFQHLSALRKDQQTWTGLDRLGQVCGEGTSTTRIPKAVDGQMVQFALENGFQPCFVAGRPTFKPLACPKCTVI